MANVRSTRHCTAASLLIFFSADRGVLMSAHSLKGRFGDGKEAAVYYTMEQVEARTRGTLSWSYSWNSTGYLDADAFKAVQAKAGEDWSTRKTGINAVLFSDQLAAHRRADIVEFAMTLKLFISSPAPKNSHTIQLLDEVSFGALQSGNTRRNEEAVMDAVLTNTDSRDTLLLSASAAERQAFSLPVIQSSFRCRGLFPGNPKMMDAIVGANLEMVETRETATETARSASSLVVQAAQERIDVARTGSQSGRAVLNKGVVHSPFLLLDKHRKTVEEASKEEGAKADNAQMKLSQEHKAVDMAAARERHRCLTCVDKVYRGGKAWTGCP